MVVVGQFLYTIGPDVYNILGFFVIVMLDKLLNSFVDFYKLVAEMVAVKLILPFSCTDQIHTDKQNSLGPFETVILPELFNLNLRLVILDQIIAYSIYLCQMVQTPQRFVARIGTVVRQVLYNQCA